MAKEMIVNATSLETRFALVEDDQVNELFIERRQNKSILGNIYKGKVTRVLPGMQAAFVDIGLDRNAFLYVADFFAPDAEYEEIFEEADEAIEELLVEDEDGVPVKRQRSRRTRSRKEGRPGPAAAKSAPRPAATTPVPPVADFQKGDLLPARLDFQSLKVVSSPGLPQTERPAAVGILPDQLPVKAALPQGGPRPADPDLPDREVRMENSGDIHRLATQSRRGRRKNGGGSRPLIGDLLKEGQEILVQIAKEPIGKKGARITSHIVLPGRYLVFMPTVDHVGVSRRIASAQERQRLKKTVEDLREGVEKGFIVRTAGEGQSEADFRQDMIYLTRLWEEIRQNSERKSAPALIHSELDLVPRVIRDFFTDDFKAIRVDDRQEYERIVSFIKNFNPKLARKVRPYTKSTPISDEYRINSEIDKALKSKVWLKNGGYIVINQTEALVAIDVNTGRYVGQTDSLEDTITKTNLDAVKEVVRQVRLRDLGGIIIVDFIDMDESRNRQKVMEALQSELARDKSPSKILQFNEFGLVAITRKRVKQSLERTLCQPCAHCAGTGMTKSSQTICIDIHQEVRKLVPTLARGGDLQIRCHPDIGKALRESGKLIVREIEEMTGKTVVIKTDPLLHLEAFSLIESKGAS